MLPQAEEKMPFRWMYQHDNDPTHTAKCVKDWFVENGTNVIKRPAQFPDLNIIQNLWEIVDRKILRQNYKDKDSLFQQAEIAWKSIPTDIFFPS